MNKSQLTHKQAGFSMIEVLMALVVVGLVLTAVAGMITNSMEARADARYRQVANEIAQKFIEKCRRDQATTKWTDFAAGVNTECLPQASSLVSGTNVGIDFYKKVTTDSTTTDILRVGVTITWSSGRGGGSENESLEVNQVFTNRN